jgi:hypothetical protein
MKIIIEATGTVVELLDGGQGSVWQGHTETGIPIVCILASLGCRTEDQPAFERAFAADGEELEFQHELTLDLAPMVPKLA